MAPETIIENEKTGEQVEIDDGYDFVFKVSDEDFQNISQTCEIPCDLKGDWTKEFYKQVWAGVMSSDGSASDEITQFLVTDDINTVAEVTMGGGGMGAVALAIGAGKLKKLKKLARWVKGNRGKKIPGTKQGGGNWANDGRGGGQVLPRKDSKGNPINYKEYDVNPAPRWGNKRGKERMVVGSDGRTYYTRDHYKTFKEFKH